MRPEIVAQAGRQDWLCSVCAHPLVDQRECERGGQRQPDGTWQFPPCDHPEIEQVPMYPYSQFRNRRGGSNGAHAHRLIVDGELTVAHIVCGSSVRAKGAVPMVGLL